MIAAGCSLAECSGHEAGQELLRRLYWQETGKSLPAIAVSPRGKPYFPDSDYHFSITHTQHHAFCVLSRRNVGIDAEEMDRPVREILYKRVLSPNEQVRAAQSVSPRETFLRLWVLKEAAAKFAGTGLTDFPNRTDFGPDDPRIHCWMGCFVALIGEDSDEGVEFYAF